MSQDMVTIDLQNYRDRQGQRVPPGRYTVAVEDVEPTVAQTGSKGFEVWLNVVEGEFKDSTLIDRLYYEKDGKPSGALFRVVAFMQACGLQTPKKRFNLRLSTLIGKVLEVDVEDGEPYQGRVRSEVRGYMRTAANGSQRGDEDLDLSGLDEFASTPDSNRAEAEKLKQKVEEAKETGDPWAEGLDLPDLDSIDL